MTTMIWIAVGYGIALSGLVVTDFLQDRLNTAMREWVKDLDVRISKLEEKERT